MSEGLNVGLYEEEWLKEKLDIGVYNLEGENGFYFLDNH